MTDPERSPSTGECAHAWPFALCLFVDGISAASVSQPAGRLASVADVRAAIAAMLERVRQRREMRAAATWPADLNAPTEEVTHG